MVRVSLRTVDAERAAAGRHHARQRAGQGRRRRVLPRRRRRPRRGEGRGLRQGDAPDRADHAALRPRQGGARRRCSPSASTSTRDLQHIIDEQTEPWGIKVTAVEIKRRRHPDDDAARDGAAGRGRARAPRQGDPRRGRAAGVAATLAEAAGVMSAHPASLQLRYLQTLRGDRRREELDDRLPGAPGQPPVAARRWRAGRRRRPLSSAGRRTAAVERQRGRADARGGRRPARWSRPRSGRSLPRL